MNRQKHTYMYTNAHKHIHRDKYTDIYINTHKYTHIHKQTPKHTHHHNRRKVAAAAAGWVSEMLYSAVSSSSTLKRVRNEP